MPEPFEVIFDTDPRDIRFWQAKLDYARGQVRALSTVDPATPKLQPIGGWPTDGICRGNVGLRALKRENFRTYQERVRHHRQQLRHLKMWLTTKIPYYEARIEALRKPALDRLVGPDPW